MDIGAAIMEGLSNVSIWMIARVAVYLCCSVTATMIVGSLALREWISRTLIRALALIVLVVRCHPSIPVRGTTIDIEAASRFITHNLNQPFLPQVVIAQMEISLVRHSIIDIIPNVAAVVALCLHLIRQCNKVSQTSVYTQRYLQSPERCSLRCTIRPDRFGIW